MLLLGDTVQGASRRGIADDARARRHAGLIEVGHELRLRVVLGD
jgi:hypothetical protein